jgi:hypothetical protein
MDLAAILNYKLQATGDKFPPEDDEHQNGEKEWKWKKGCKCLMLVGDALCNGKIFAYAIFIQH